MQKNFVQRHALFFSVIVFCFVIVPFIRNAYAQEKADKKQQAETLVIRTQKQAEEKKVTKRRVVLDAGHGGYDDGSEMCIRDRLLTWSRRNYRNKSA